MHDRQRTLSLAATWIPVQPAFVSGIYNTVYFKNTASDNGFYIFFKPPQKHQSNMSEICNEDQEKENTFDYGLDTSFKPVEDSKNFELHSDTRGKKMETEPTTSAEGAEFQNIHNDGMIGPCEENEDKDTPGCFNLGLCFRNMRKYFQKKYTQL
ncbi:hypothetical protein NDU88_006067 [Pleurodeles waltl]|uniref:Uncharacterized protein n=1 Tax=Pleurodeles waltl TaxID=8319 RepID=A0AAV7MBT9_PLEWA|nr:hypothetical protein NDU88_006067 [Pleurodeles waltl]